MKISAGCETWPTTRRGDSPSIETSKYFLHFYHLRPRYGPKRNFQRWKQHHYSSRDSRHSWHLKYVLFVSVLGSGGDYFWLKKQKSGMKETKIVLKVTSVGSLKYTSKNEIKQIFRWIPSSIFQRVVGAAHPPRVSRWNPRRAPQIQTIHTKSP